MIVNKNNKKIDEPQVFNEPLTPSLPVESESSVEEVMVRVNPMTEIYKAVREMLLMIKEDPDDPDSPSYFKTIKIDNGQLARIKRDRLNDEYGIGFPAVFIHFINVYYNQGTMNISEGKGTLRIHYVLNRLNNSDDGDEGELEGMNMFKRIVDVIESNKSKYPALAYKFQLQYWDQPLSFDDGLQPYWIDYQVWFKDYTGYVYKNFKDVYVTHPPFTQPSDQNEIANPDKTPNHETPTFESSVKISETGIPPSDESAEQV